MNFLKKIKKQHIAAGGLLLALGGLVFLAWNLSKSGMTEVEEMVGNADIIERSAVEIDITEENVNDFVELSESGYVEPEKYYEKVTIAGFPYEISEDDVKYNNDQAPRVYYGYTDEEGKILVIEPLANVIKEEECEKLLGYSNPICIIPDDGKMHMYEGGKFDFKQEGKAAEASTEKKDKNIIRIAGIQYRVDGNEIRLVDDVKTAPYLYFETINGVKYIMIENNGVDITGKDGKELSKFVGNNVYLFSEDAFYIFDGTNFVKQ